MSCDRSSRWSETQERSSIGTSDALQDRMSHLGGVLQVHSDESGTSVTAILPLSAIQQTGGNEG